LKVDFVVSSNLGGGTGGKFTGGRKEGDSGIPKVVGSRRNIKNVDNSA